MNVQKIAVEVIRQEMRYNQQIEALAKLGIEVNDDYNLDLLDAALMFLDADHNPHDSVTKLYLEYLSRSARYEIMPNGENLYHLAEECYLALQHLYSAVAPTGNVG